MDINWNKLEKDFFAWQMTPDPKGTQKIFDWFKTKITQSSLNNKALGIGDVINWAYFDDQKPNYGEEIIIQYPPEQMTKPIITIFDKNTEWINGCKYAVITPCL